MWEAVFRGLSDVLDVECVRVEGLSGGPEVSSLILVESHSLSQAMLKGDCVLAEDPEFVFGFCRISSICMTGRRRPVGSLMS